MRLPSICLFCVVPVIFVFFAAGEEPSPITLSFDDALRQTLLKNPQIAAAGAREEEARGQRVQAGLRPNPRIFVQSEDIRPGGANPPFSFANSTEDYLYVGQLIEAGGKRGRREDLADSRTRTTLLEADLLRRQLLGRTGIAYWAAAGAARVRELLAESLVTYEQDVTYSTNRVREGVMAETDLMRVELERDRTRADLLLAKRQADTALVDLYRAMGQAEFPVAHLTGSLEQPRPYVPPALTAILETRPEMKIAAEAVTEAESDLRLQRANGKPDPEAYVGYKRDVGYDTLYAAVQVDLPFWNRNQGNVASAQARLRMAQANLAATELSVRAEVESAERAYKEELDVIAMLPGALARARETERLARAAYREGAVDLLRLLDAERTRIQSEVQYYRALTDLQQSFVNLVLATGENIEGRVTP